MDLSEPASALAPGLTLPLLRAAASRAGGATAEQLRRVAGVGTAAGVRRALERLAEHGVLHETRVGERGALYELNRDHVLYPTVQALLGVGDVLPSRLNEHFQSWPVPPVTAALFGSAARRDGGLHSDIDLLLIRSDDVTDDSGWEEQVHALRDQVHRWTGNHAQVLERTRRELSQLVDNSEAIVEEWRRDAVTVHGQDLDELLEEIR